jgi:hypothetical protein
MEEKKPIKVEISQQYLDAMKEVHSLSQEEVIEELKKIKELENANVQIFKQ